VVPPRERRDHWSPTTPVIGRRFEGCNVEQRAQVGVQCPKCLWRQFMEVEIDPQIINTPLAREIQAHLEEWMLSRCPNHLGEFLKTSKN
jgi:hypothetical protein